MPTLTTGRNVTSFWLPAPRMSARGDDWVALLRISPSARLGTSSPGDQTVSHLSPDFRRSAETVYFHSPVEIFQL